MGVFHSSTWIYIFILYTLRTCDPIVSGVNLFRLEMSFRQCLQHLHGQKRFIHVDPRWPGIFGCNDDLLKTRPDSQVSTLFQPSLPASAHPSVGRVCQYLEVSRQPSERVIMCMAGGAGITCSIMFRASFARSYRSFRLRDFIAPLEHTK